MAVISRVLTATSTTYLVKLYSPYDYRNIKIYQYHPVNNLIQASDDKNVHVMTAKWCCLQPYGGARCVGSVPWMRCRWTVNGFVLRPRLVWHSSNSTESSTSSTVSSLQTQRSARPTRQPARHCTA